VTASDDIPGACGFSGCDRQVRTNGHCNAHAEQIRRRAPLTALKPRQRYKAGAECSVDGCDRGPKSNGLCDAHWQQSRRGRPLAALKSWAHPRRPMPKILPHPTDATLALVPLTKGHFAVISAVDVPEVGRYRWAAKETATTVYAFRYLRGSKPRKHQYLHILIGEMMGLSLSAEVDHRNRNGLDCRRSNLRDATHAQNACNTSLSPKNTSGVKGVSWRSDKKTWRATIKVNRKQRFLGHFDAIDDAAAAVVRARAELHGEFGSDGIN